MVCLEFPARELGQDELSKFLALFALRLDIVQAVDIADGPIAVLEVGEAELGQDDCDVFANADDPGPFGAGAPVSPSEAPAAVLAEARLRADADRSEDGAARA